MKKKKRASLKRSMDENTSKDLTVENLTKAIEKMKAIESSAGRKLSIQPNMFIFPWIPLKEKQEKEE